jgi:hypothetical protein
VVIDEFTRECLAIEVARSFTARDVIMTLQYLFAALGKLRELLQGDVGVAAQVLKALVGDVVITTQQVQGQEKPQMVARLTINAVPALAVLERGRPTDRDGAPVPVWDSIHSSPNPGAATAAAPAEAIVPLVYDRRAAARKAAKKRDGAA